MRILVLFVTTIALSTVLFAISLLVTSSHPTSIALHAAASSVAATPPPTTSPRHCDQVVARRKPATARPRTPPWEVLLNDTGTNRTRLLYVHVWAAQTRRLGNQLFNYASLFGIAWRNGRMVPLWPDARTHLRTAFRPRIPIDHNNTIINVSN